jgi:hypothetical protein
MAGDKQDEHRGSVDADGWLACHLHPLVMRGLPSSGTRPPCSCLHGAPPAAPDASADAGSSTAAQVGGPLGLCLQRRHAAVRHVADLGPRVCIIVGQRADSADVNRLCPGFAHGPSALTGWPPPAAPAPSRWQTSRMARATRQVGCWAARCWDVSERARKAAPQPHRRRGVPAAHVARPASSARRKSAMLHRAPWRRRCLHQQDARLARPRVHRGLEVHLQGTAGVVAALQRPAPRRGL